MSNDIRKNRLAKNISQVKLAEVTGFSEGQIIRIEQGVGRTTEEEVNTVLKAIKDLPANDRRIAGRPFSDPSKRAEDEKLRPAKAEAAPAKATSKKAAPAKATAKKATATKKAAKATKSLADVLP